MKSFHVTITTGPDTDKTKTVFASGKQAAAEMIRMTYPPNQRPLVRISEVKVGDSMKVSF